MSNYSVIAHFLWVSVFLKDTCVWVSVNVTTVTEWLASLSLSLSRYLLSSANGGVCHFSIGHVGVFYISTRTCHIANARIVSLSHSRSLSGNWQVSLTYLLTYLLTYSLSLSLFTCHVSRLSSLLSSRLVLLLELRALPSLATAPLSRLAFLAAQHAFKSFIPSSILIFLP